MRRALATCGWGLYLASSWTWCIGMFLPILLLRWWGWPGFLCFAIPNAIGCALFGYVLTPASSRAFCERFAPALRCFAWITIAYQAWFVQWATNGVPTASGLAPLAAVIPLGFLFFPGGKRFWPIAGSLAFIASMVFFFMQGSTSLTHLPDHGTLPPDRLLSATPFMAFGFLLCPYLDPTFHRALQQSPSKHCFAVFGLTFLLALLFAASTFDQRIATVSVTSFTWMQWILQTTFTMAAMIAVTAPIARESWPDAPVQNVAAVWQRSMMSRLVWAICLPAMAVVLGPMLLQIVTIITKEFPLFMPASVLLPGGEVSAFSAGEATYLRWLGLYGVLFPGWLLLKLRGRSTATIAITLLIAAALADIGVVGARTHLLSLALLVLGLAAFWPFQRVRTFEVIPLANFC